MLRNHLKIALRDLWKNKGIASINVFSLSIGLACFALFTLYALNEFSFDRFHQRADRLFFVHQSVGELNGQKPRKDVILPMPLGPALKADLPDVAQFARLQSAGEVFLITPKGTVKEEAAFTDPAFFDMFSFPVLYGDPATALGDLNSVVLTKAMAQKLFGEDNPTDKILKIKIEDNFESFRVSAVTEDVPSNSSIRFGILLPMEKYAATKNGKAATTRWHRFSMMTFVELRPGSGLTADTATMAQFFLKYFPDDEKSLRAEGRWNRPERPFAFGFTPVRARHHDPMIGISPTPTLFLLGIGGIILLIACINFTTLAIGRSASRAREVGVRKFIGASRLQLSRQFLIEALLLSTCSTLVGGLLALALLPAFNELTDKNLTFDLQQFPELLGLIPALALVAGLLAGSYPAFVLSGLPALETLKNKLKIGGENWFTRSLVTFQFVLSVGLMACTFVTVRQLDFLRSRNPGFDKENVVVVNAEGANNPKNLLGVFRQSLAGQPQILGVSGAELSLGADAGWSMSGFDYKGQSKSLFEYYVDGDYMKVLGLQLLACRNFNPEIASDSLTSVIFNETAVREFGWTNETALGQVLTGYYEKEPEKNPVVIGVVRDYNFRSMHQAVQPMMFTHFHDYDPLQYFVRIAPGDPQPALERLQRAWASAEPLLPFRYNFLDENLDKFYASEEKLSRTIGLAGGIAVLLACLGLLGLTALSMLNRTREIGIRKVLGASVAGISGLLAKDFLKLVLIAIGIASPLAWYVMQQWLADFAYRIELQAWMFAGAGAAAVAVAVLTVGFQAVRAALANPVKSLRSE